MKRTRKIGLYITVFAVIFAVGSCFFMQHQKQVNPFGKAGEQQVFSNFDTSAAIQKALAPVAGKIIVPHSKAEIEEIYKDITMVEVPHVFIDALPADWKIESVADKTLFMKIVTALILRTNEQITNERAALRLLQEKQLKKIPWNAEETAFYQKMNEKYDTIIKRRDPSKFAELLDKINTIPPSLAVAQAIFYTDWGQKNQKAIYGEFGWRDDETYEPIAFDSLTQATDSFALQLNTRSQLFKFREVRKYVIPMERTRYTGIELLSFMDKYMEEDDDYVNNLIETFKKGKIKELDWACFKGTCQMPEDDASLGLE